MCEAPPVLKRKFAFDETSSGVLKRPGTKIGTAVGREELEGAKEASGLPITLQFFPGKKVEALAYRSSSLLFQRHVSDLCM